jgi:hypothetical protein
VSAVEHELVLQHGITAFDLRQNVARFEAAHVVANSDGDSCRKRERPKARCGGCGSCFMEIVAGHREEGGSFLRSDERFRSTLSTLVAITQNMFSRA